MRSLVWKDEFYVKTYRLAKSGHTKARIAQIIGVGVVTFNRWLTKRPALRVALKEGRLRTQSAVNFRRYVYRRLPPQLQAIWDRINKLEKKKNGITRIEAILEDAGKAARQHLFLYAWCTGGFNSSAACRAVNISRQMYEEWYKSDPDFHALFDEMDQHKKDFMEGALMDLIEERDTSAVIFANKTYNQDRGYGQKLEVKHSGQITHNVNVIKIADLDLDIEQKKILLQAIRERNDSLEAIEGRASNVLIA